MSLVTIWLTVWLGFAGTAYGGDPRSQETMVIKVIRLEYADAQRLASLLRPLLTQAGRITAYSATNSLIIRDKKSLVEQLVHAIEGVKTP